jgi:hypothetical protein
MYFFNMDQAKKDYLKEQDFSVLRSDYLAWLRRRRFTGDRDKYLIDGSVCVDYFIRHESLLDDLKEVCRRLGIDRDVAELEKFKSQSRPTDRHFSEFYDDEGGSSPRPMPSRWVTSGIGSGNNFLWMHGAVESARSGPKVRAFLELALPAGDGFLRLGWMISVEIRFANALAC